MFNDNQGKNLKVDLFIIDNTPIGGVERVTRSLINQFLPEDYNRFDIQYCSN